MCAWQVGPKQTSFESSSFGTTNGKNKWIYICFVNGTHKSVKCTTSKATRTIEKEQVLLFNGTI